MCSHFLYSVFYRKPHLKIYNFYVLCKINEVRLYFKQATSVTNVIENSY